MYDNKEINEIKDAYHNIEQGNQFEKRLDDRRKESNDGFTYISSVGWIDRRETLRRRGDPFYY
jgi:plasmid replication initiation protein